MPLSPRFNAEELDVAVADLGQHIEEWATLPISEKRQFMQLDSILTIRSHTYLFKPLC